jgi:hypothetical protein
METALAGKMLRNCDLARLNAKKLLAKNKIARPAMNIVRSTAMSFFMIK